MKLWWPKFVEPEVASEASSAPVFLCGVPECPDGFVTGEDGKYTVVECRTHEARTHWDTEPAAQGEQQIIRVQDGWRQHGSSQPPTQKR